MPAKPPVPYTALYRDIFARLCNGRYHPTQRIGIGDLASRSGVSTTPVREVLRHLAGRDVVVERHREGFYLAPLSARAIADFYLAHADVVNNALGLGVPNVKPPRASSNIWGLFDMAAKATGNAAITSTRRYLADRLAILRRHELAIPAMPKIADAFRQALVTSDIEQAQAISRTFHTHCTCAAEDLARAYEGPV